MLIRSELSNTCYKNCARVGLHFQNLVHVFIIVLGPVNRTIDAVISNYPLVRLGPLDDNG